MFTTTADWINWLRRRYTKSGSSLPIRGIEGVPRQTLQFSSFQHVASERGGRVLVTHVGDDVIVVGLLTPKAAKADGLRMVEAATRADYEDDFARLARGANLPADLVSSVMSTVRHGEHERRSMDARPDRDPPGENTE